MIAIDQINHYKIVLLGEGRVGKTSVLVRYIEDSFVEGRNSTLQAAYFDKTIAIDASDDYCESAAYDQQLNYSNNKNAVEEKRREAKLSIWDVCISIFLHSIPDTSVHACNFVLNWHFLTPTYRCTHCSHTDCRTRTIPLFR
mmetsp:Transcript_22715/g.46172  ORF Transcript_22715/g.46172 Transcript_22715/m.46172 type:complete len:142 (+) Transcript_22715:238-663(+)